MIGEAPTMMYGRMVSCPLEVADNPAWAAHCETLATLGAADTARQAGYRPALSAFWVGWQLQVWDLDSEAPIVSHRLPGPPGLVDLPMLAAGQVAAFLVAAEVTAVPDVHQRLANAMLALAWRRAAEDYGSVAR
jgi:hypothetical protein